MIDRSPLWEPYKPRYAVGRTGSSVDTVGQADCGVEQTFDRVSQNRRSSGKIERPRRADTQRGRATFENRQATGRQQGQ